MENPLYNCINDTNDNVTLSHSLSNGNHSLVNDVTSKNIVSSDHTIDVTKTEQPTELRPKSVLFKGPRKNGPTKSRRVSFPKDSLVKGFLEPPNPWADSSLKSNDQLIEAYHKSCERMNIKPLIKLVNQLHVISNFDERNETLTLKGEKLDIKHCDSLEEVLRRVQFRTIDLENTHLENEAAVAIFDMLEYYESCIKLNISFNKNLGLRGWQSCSRLMKKTPCIEQLDARNCDLTEQAVPILGRAIRMGSQLNILHLENSILSGRPLMILVTAIKMNLVLRELYLADNKLMPSDGVQLGNMLKFNHKLQLLDIRNNHLQDVGTVDLCNGLLEQNSETGLQTLVLWNNQITYQSCDYVGRALASTKSLETLNLGHNNITNEGIHRLKEGLLKNRSLLRMGLQAARISCEGTVALAEFIAESPRLIRIDLRENNIKTGGLLALFHASRTSQTVSRVDIDKEPKKEPSANVPNWLYDRIGYNVVGMKEYAACQQDLIQQIQDNTANNREIQRQKELSDMMKETNREKQPEEIPESVPQNSDDKIVEENEGKNVSDDQDSAITLENVLSRIETLESPAFVREYDMPVIKVPTELNLVSSSTTIENEISAEYPPSPLTSKLPAKDLLGSVICSPVDEMNNHSDIVKFSPKSKRKFSFNTDNELECEDIVQEQVNFEDTVCEQEMKLDNVKTQLVFDNEILFSNPNIEDHNPLLDEEATSPSQISFEHSLNIPSDTDLNSYKDLTNCEASKCSESSEVLVSSSDIDESGTSDSQKKENRNSLSENCEDPNYSKTLAASSDIDESGTNDNEKSENSECLKDMNSNDDIIHCEESNYLESSKTLVTSSNVDESRPNDIENNKNLNSISENSECLKDFNSNGDIFNCDASKFSESSKTLVTSSDIDVIGTNDVEHNENLNSLSEKCLNDSSSPNKSNSPLPLDSEDILTTSLDENGQKTDVSNTLEDS